MEKKPKASNKNVNNKKSLKGSVFDFQLIIILLINLTFYAFANIWWLKIILYKMFGCIKIMFVVFPN